jgi:hypothetical protein
MAGISVRQVTWSRIQSLTRICSLRRSGKCKKLQEGLSKSVEDLL